MFLADAFDKFIEDDCEGRIKPREVYRYREIQHSWRLDMPSMQPDDVRPKHVIDWRHRLIIGRVHTPGRRAFSDKPRVRPQVQRYVRCFINAVRWFAQEEICSYETYYRLTLIRGLRKGEHGVKESKPQEAVDRSVVMETLKHIRNESARDMIMLMLHTGMRPSEVVDLWEKDIYKSGDVWVWRLHDFKTDNVVGTLEYRFGPEGQEIIKRQASKKRLEKGPLFRNDRGQPWSRESFSGMVLRKCRKHGIPLWTPKQLRKRFSTDVAAKYGLMGEAAIIGHTPKVAAKAYAARNVQLAEEIARNMG